MKLTRQPGLAGRQRGITLLVALVMMIAMTMFALSSFKIGDLGLKLASNSQDQLRVRDIAEANLNKILYDIHAGIAADPCNEASLKAGFGSMGKMLEYGVETEPSFRVIGGSCVKKNSVTESWEKANEAKKISQAAVEAACQGEEESEGCIDKKEDYAEKEKTFDYWHRRLEECVTDHKDANENDSAASGTSDENSYCVDVDMEIGAAGRDVNTQARSAIARGVLLNCSNHDIPGC